MCSSDLEHEPPPAQEYAQDEYATNTMERQYPCYLDAFRKKETIYRPLLPEEAVVLEIGSHYGAFLQTAAEWGWLAEGVDPGKDTSRFAQSKGFTVHVAALEDCPFPDQRFDGIFIWNCFEQIDDPGPTLIACRRILKLAGLLTVRVPNGSFYTSSQILLHDEEATQESKDFVLRALGYNNLLGFPYRYGHNTATLRRLIESHGFAFEASVDSELLTFPLPENPPWVEREERELSRDLRLLNARTAPWIEVRFRAT